MEIAALRNKTLLRMPSCKFCEILNLNSSLEFQWASVSDDYCLYLAKIWSRKLSKGTITER